MALSQKWRVLVAEVQEGESELELVAFIHPKHNKKTWYLVGKTSENVYELQSFADNSECSLFIDNYCCQDNTMYLINRMDPLYLLVSILLRNRMKSHSDANQYCMQPITQQICCNECETSTLFKKFVTNTKENELILNNICKVRNVDDSEPLYVVLDDAKVLKWLHKKVEQIRNSLHGLKYTNDLDPSNNYLIQTLSIISEYIPNYFFTKLCQNYNVSMSRVESGSKKRKMMDSDESDLKTSEHNEKIGGVSQTMNKMSGLSMMPSAPPAAKKQKTSDWNANKKDEKNEKKNNTTSHDFSLGNIGTPLKSDTSKSVNNRPRTMKNKQLAKASTRGMKSMMSYFSAKKK